MDLREAGAYGGLLFVALLLFSAPALVEPVGFVMALTICRTMVYDEYVIWRNIRRLEREHERL